MGDNFGREPMLDMYIFETVQLIEQLEQVIIDSEKNQEIDTQMDEIFRIMHTIKGNSMMMLFDDIGNLAHAIEDLFDYLRTEQPEETDHTAITDLVLETVDFIKNEMVKLEAGKEADGDASELTGTIKSYLESLKFMNSSDEFSEDKKQEVEEEKKKEEKIQQYYISAAKPKMTEEETNKYKAIIYFEDGCQMENVRAFTILHNIEDIISDVYTIPKNVIEEENSTDVIREQGFKMFFESEAGSEELKEVLSQGAFVRHIEFEPITKEDFDEIKFEYFGIESEGVIVETEIKEETISKEEKEAKEAKKEEIKKQIENIESSKSKKLKESRKEAMKSAPPKNTKQSYISVGVSKLDVLMDLVGELVVSEAMVTRNTELKDVELDDFYKAARHHRKIINDIQDIVMSVRMVSLSLTFQKMNRLVRDMAKKVNKEVNLNIIGAETEVDKNVIEHISDPLMHLIRNSVDHGLENAEERKDSGKNPKGTITLEAKHSGGYVWITVKDDGKGIDKNQIIKKASEKGMLTKAVEDYSEKEIYSLIFEPGFSTKEAVSEFSGRGVGLDVAIKNIEKIGGSIIVESNLGEGTEISIKIPLTLAIIDGMIVGVGKATYILPITSIKESFKVKDEEIIKDPDDNEMIWIRGECYPIVRLYKMFELESEAKKISDGIIVMIENDEETICIFVDKLLGEQQVVVKSLSSYIKNIDGISGCALLGDGSISLIIDPSALISRRKK